MVQGDAAMKRRFSALSRFLMLNCIHGRKGLKLLWKGVVVIKTTILNEGKNNRPTIGEGTWVEECVFHFSGNNNVVEIADDCAMHGLELWISGGSTISIGKQTYINGHSLIACHESTTVEIGERCLLADSVTLRTGDSHSVLDAEGKRTNPSRSIYVGKHVWVGHQVIILKGSSIADDSVVGSGTLIAGQSFPAGSEIVGNPARILKEHINWTSDLV